MRWLLSRSGCIEEDCSTCWDYLKSHQSLFESFRGLESSRKLEDLLECGQVY
jgi:hypothetical protein